MAMEQGSEAPESVEQPDREDKPIRPKKTRGKTRDDDRKPRSAPPTPRQPAPDLVDEGDWNGPVPSFLGQGLGD
jgi:hypothetical protein